MVRAIVVALLLMGCAPAEASFLSEVGAVSGGSYLDLPYGPDPAQKLDVYFPIGGVWGANPAVVSVFGGGWGGGDKRDGAGPLHLAQIKAFLQAGYTVVNVGYRLAPTHQHPAQVYDIRRAIRWAKRNSAGIGINPSKVFLWGESSGGHLALMVATAQQLNDPTDYDQTTSVGVRAAGAASAPTDFTKWDSDTLKKGCPLYNGVGWQSPGSALMNLMGVQPLSEGSPLGHLDPSDLTPLFLGYGTEDCTVPDAQGWVFATAAREVGNKNVMVVGLSQSGHNDGVFLGGYFTSSVVGFFNRFR